MRADVAHRVGDVAGLRDDLEVRLGLEQHPQPAAHDGVVVGEDDRGERRIGGVVGIGACANRRDGLRRAHPYETSLRLRETTDSRPIQVGDPGGEVLSAAVGGDRESVGGGRLRQVVAELPHDLRPGVGVVAAGLRTSPRALDAHRERSLADDEPQPVAIGLRQTVEERVAVRRVAERRVDHDGAAPEAVDARAPSSAYTSRLASGL